MNPITFLNPYNLPAGMLHYALGQTSEYPNVTGVARKQVTTMDNMRRAFIRNLLTEKKQVSAHALPDFNQLMAAEIWQYAKSELRPVLFRDWDARIRETPRFSEVFYHEDAQLHREYHDAAQQNKRFTKHRYLSITSKRRAFAIAVKDATILGELEYACFGELRYGLP